MSSKGYRIKLWESPFSHNVFEGNESRTIAKLQLSRESYENHRKMQIKITT
jgi:hypothetical protein